MDKDLITRYLDCRRFPLSNQKEAARLHNALCEKAPEFYLHLLTDPVAHISHKREMLLNLLLAGAARQQAERQRLIGLLNLLPLEQGLQIIQVIYDLRINRSSTSELMLAYLLGHERLAELAAIKRQRLGRLLRHALGERTWSSVRRFLANPTPEGEQFLQRELLRYAWKGDVARAREVLCFLTGVPFNATQPALVRSLSARQDLNQGKGLPQETLSGLRGIYHPQTPLRSIRQLAAPAPATTRMDGPFTAAYKDALAKRAAEDGASAEEQLPVIEARMAVVLDMSGSMASSGERLNHPVALALALTRLLRMCISDLQLFQAGGSTRFAEDVLPQPAGAADIAQSLLEAVQSKPQLILIITDGYESLRQGDCAWVVKGLRELAYNMPIYQVVPLFTSAEKLDQRRLHENIPIVPIAHEEQIRELLAYVVLSGAGEQLAAAELQQLQRLLTER